jgi:phenylacetate-CoA ligase
MVGEPCRCGRGLPVLKRIMGRERNLLVLPDGRSRWPSLGQGADLASLPPFHQVQIVQKTVNRLEVRAVVPAVLSRAQEDQVREYIRREFGYPFEIAFTYVDEIPRGLGGKWEDFRSEVR